MPRRSSPLPPSLGAAFTYRDALAAGATAGRLRSRDIEHPFHGARLRMRQVGDEQIDADAYTIDRRARERVQLRARAFAHVMGSQACFTGMTAAALLGAPLPDGFDPESDLCVATPYPHRATRARGVRGIQLRPHLASMEVRDGLRMTSPASTWALLGGELSERWLVIVGDYLVRVPRDDRGRRHPELQLTSPVRMDAALREPGRRHRSTLERAAASIRVGSFSRLETEYRLDAAHAGLPEMEIDVEIRDAGGRLLGIADGVHRSAGVIVEVEGDHHRTSRRQWNRDIDRLAAFAAHGWEVIRLTGARVRGGTAVPLVAAALARRARAL